MRDRDQLQTQNYAATQYAHDLLLNTSAPFGPYNSDVVVHESLMSDKHDGGRRAIKPVTHLKYDVLSIADSWEAYHSADQSNAPLPRLRYILRPEWERMDAFRPVLSNPSTYIPVKGITSDDLGDCAFRAYNQFINSVRALDSSVSIAELRETPKLFEIWQRRRGLATNLTNGFLNYSFGWRPLLSDLRAITRELRSFPNTVRRRLKAIGQGEVVRHYKFDLSSTIDDVHASGYVQNAPYSWGRFGWRNDSVNKRRVVCVTIRARVKPKLTGDGQRLLDKLGTLGLIPSLATIWSITRLSFVVDWFFNIGGAIENLQGSLTHDISNVSVCVSDKRTRVIELRATDTSGPDGLLLGRIEQTYYSRGSKPIPVIPSLRYPQRAMNYVLLGLIGLSSTNTGKRILVGLDGFRLPNKVNDKITLEIRRLLNRTVSPHTRRLIRQTFGI